MIKKFKDCPKISTILNDDGVLWSGGRNCIPQWMREPTTISIEDAFVLCSIPASSETLGS
jgi:hypothetical protein